MLRHRLVHRHLRLFMGIAAIGHHVPVGEGLVRRGGELIGGFHLLEERDGLGNAALLGEQIAQRRPPAGGGGGGRGPRRRRAGRGRGPGGRGRRRGGEGRPGGGGGG